MGMARAARAVRGVGFGQGARWHPASHLARHLGSRTRTWSEGAIVMRARANELGSKVAEELMGHGDNGGDGGTKQHGG